MQLHVYHPEARRIAQRLVALEPGRDVVALASAQDLAAALPDIEILYAAVPPRTGWSAASRLRVIHVMGVGVDHFLPSPDLGKDVVIACARGIFAPEASEHAMALLLSLRRAIPTCVTRQREREFKQFASPALAGSTALVLGAGAIGSRIVKLCAALDMHVIAMRRSGSPVPHAKEVVRREGLLDALSRADHVLVALPRTAETTKLLSDDAFERMPRGALVVCVGRGGVIDEGALIRALESGHLGGAAIDVFDKEPLDRQSPLWTTPNLLVTPHVAGVGLRYQERVDALFLENVRRIERGEAPLDIIDRAAGY